MPDRYDVNPEEAALVQRMNLAVQDGFYIEDIAGILNDEAEERLATSTE